MSKKYVIEIKPEYEDSFKGLMILGAKDSNLFVDTLAVDDLEELNSDYINEHYGELQDEAYKKGINDGSLDVKQRVEGAYQKGFEDGKAVNDKGCEGCKYGGSPQGSSPCYNCSNYYKNNWTAKDDKIEVGDEVNWSCDCFIVTRIFQPRNGKEQCDGIDDDGCVYHDVLIKDLEKTDRHFDIEKILETMKE